MISTKAIEIVPLLEKPSDYNEYVAKCQVMDFPILPFGSYAQKYGILLAGQTRYPDLELREAYLKAMDDINKDSTVIIPPKSGKKSCCGGNKTEGAEVK